MRIYNTLKGQKEEFIPLEENRVRMYVCGPTVYNYIHVGNARPIVVFDTLRKFLEYRGYDVTYVSNFTDIDDRIIKQAIIESTDIDNITMRYIAAVEEDERGLNVKPPTHRPRATEEIPEIIKMIEELIKKGYAYEKNGSVFYRTGAFSEYGKLSKKNLDELNVGARIEVDEDKESPFDFVLWKPAKEAEPKWESPWSDGRPGWHIECSVMAKKYLGDTMDIHAGGEDLIFPHHENEIAQSEAATGKEFSRYWMHLRHVNVDNTKMSKSKGNFFTVREVADKYDYNVIRFLILSSHYRSPLNFSEELMVAAKNSLMRIQTAVFNLDFLMKNNTAEKLTDEEKKLLTDSSAFKQNFIKSMEDDLNTADGISHVFELVKFANVHAGENSSKEFVRGLIEEITELTEVLGISLEEKKENNTNDSEIEALIEKRQEAKKSKEYALADTIRQQLSDMGVVLEDTRQGVRWSYK